VPSRYPVPIPSSRDLLVGTPAPPSSAATAEPEAPPPSAPAVARPGQRFRHLRALDGLRGIAVLTVVLYHFAPGLMSGGFLGVDLFFVLSGFLITSLLVSEWDAARRISLSSFWLRRARRLLPALFVVLGAVAIYELVFASRVEANHVGSDGLWSIVYLANWHFIATGQSYIAQFLFTTPSPLRHMWSLAIEEQFYLVWPLVVVGIGALAKRRAGRAPRQYRRFRAMLLGFILIVGVASLVRMLTLYGASGDPNRVYYGTDTRAFIILFGAALGVISAGTPTVRGALRLPLIVIGSTGALVLAVLMTTLTTSSAFLYRGGYAVIALVMAVVLAAAAQPGRNPLAVILRWRPLVGLGLISYGVYLWHWPIGLWVTADNTGLDGPALFVVRCALTLGAALASYYLVEMPIRRNGFSRLGRVGSRTAPIAWVGAVVVLLVVPTLVFPAVAAPPKDVAPSAGGVGITATYADAPRCDGGPAPVPIDPARKLRVQLEGNSLAGEIRNCLGTILEARNATLEGVNPPGFLLCKVIPDIEKQVENPATRPDAAVLFVFAAYDPRCGQPWHWPVDDLIKIWKKAGTHVYLVPSVPFVPGTKEAGDLSAGPLEEVAYYQQLAAADPEHITLLDAGRFIRDANDNYVWRMPCVSRSEPGCDAQGTIGVRYVDGLHFCTDPEFSAHGCEGKENQGGERRATAAVASGLLPSLATLATKSKRG
jgi:peptidoglycan/LPS O-acetylase OafA/YrhL